MVQVNAYLRVTIRVTQNGATQQLQQIRSQLNGIQSASKGAANGINSIFGGQGAANMEKFGKNLQWTGRQLEYRFTLPLAVAGAAVGKWALDNEAALTRVRKVYGGLNKPIAEVNAEVDALGKTFRVLSDMFGVNQKEVISIAAAWAQAGASGAGLAKQTRLTIEAMILGEIASEDATRGLIAIQAQYALSADGLKDAFAILNVVENETAVSTADLIAGFERSAGTMRTAGVDVRHLAALMAALVPATGSAENAGNALKTITSRIMAPTSDMNELYGLLGINISSAAWQSKNFTERLIEVAEATENLTAPQKSVVGAVMASRFQVSKFDILLRDILDPLGAYQKALSSTADMEKVRTQYTKEIGIQLASQPQQVKILWQQIKNMATQAIVPLIPYLIMFLKKLVQLSHWFTGLSPTIRKTALAGLFFLAVLGPILAYLGAFVVLGSVVWKTFMALGTGLGLFGKLFEKVFGKTLIQTAGMAGRGLGQLVGLMARGFGQLIRLAAAGAMALLRTDAAAWTGRLVLHSLGWVRMQAIAVIYWTRRIAMEVAGWVAIRTAMVMHWAAQLAFDAAQTLVSWGIARRGTLGHIAIKVGEWVTMRALTVAGWAALLGTHVAGWSAAALTATIGSMSVAAASVGWIPLLIAAVVIAMVIFHKRIGEGLQAAVGWFAKLPGAIHKVFMVLINMVKNFGTSFRRMLNDALNPFQRHSPSLVDLVNAGVDIIAAKYASLKDVGRVFRQAASDIAAFRSATEGSRKESEGGTFAKQREDILTVSPDAGPAIDNLLAGIRTLEGVLEDIGREYVRQNAIVMEWAAALKAANAEVDIQEKKLSKLKDTADALADDLAAAKSRLADLADTPITGMKAMSDALFANEMAQKRLRLEMLRLGEAGDTVDDLKGKISSLQGDIELARGEQASLRQAGATRDILAPFEGQITQMEAQQRVLGNQIASTSNLQKQMDDLQRQGEILELERALAFDPLRRQIDEVTNSMEEMPFDELLAKIKAEQANVASLTAQWDQANAAMKEQEAVVEGAIAARDRIQETYDAEKLSLDELGEAYDSIEERIRSMKSELEGMASAASAAKEKLDELSTVESNFTDAGLGDYEIPGGGFTVPGEGGLLEIEDLTKDWQAELDRAFGEVDILAPLKKLFEKGKKWVEDNFAEIGVAIIGTIAFGMLGGPLWAALFILLVIFKDEAFRWVKDNFLSVGIGIITAIIFGIVTWGGGGAMLLGLALGAVLGKLLDFAANFARDHFGETGAMIVETIGEGIINGPGPMLFAIVEVLVRLIDRAWNWIHERFPDVGTKIIELIIGGLFGKAGELAMALDDILGNPIERAIAWGVNKGITALNWLIDQINRLPGVDIGHIGYVGGGGGDSTGSANRALMSGQDPYVGEMASGGVVPGVNLARTGPFITKGARAIVGEGSKTHPEFVIPTDPRFRGRAQGLYEQLGTKLYAEGGIINKITDFAKSRSQDARSAVFGPIHEGMAKLISAIGHPLIEPPLHHANNALFDWLRGVQQDAAPSAGMGGGMGGGSVGNGWQAITDYLDSVGMDYTVTSTVRPGAMTADGNLSNHALGKAVDLVGDMPAIFNILKNIGQSLSELFFDPAGHSIKNGQIVDWIAGGHDDHVHAATFAKGGIMRAANGALIRATAGGSLIRAGEGGQDEAVVPLPRNMRADGLGLGNARSEIHFHGDLSFPNITSADDAEEFIHNLETLAAS